MQAATAANHARHPERATQLGEQAAEEMFDEPRRAAAARIWLLDLYRFALRWDDVKVASARALTLLRPGGPSTLLATALSKAAMYADRASNVTPTEQVRNAVEAVAVADATGDPPRSFMRTMR